jgi:hypothetical protein
MLLLGSCLPSETDGKHYKLNTFFNMEKYEITVKKLESYEETNYRWETEDGTRYMTEYAVPDEHKKKAKKVSFKTGDIKWNGTEIYRQEVAELKIEDVIKAVNVLK